MNLIRLSVIVLTMQETWTPSLPEVSLDMVKLFLSNQELMSKVLDRTDARLELLQFLVSYGVHAPQPMVALPLIDGICSSSGGNTARDCGGLEATGG